MQQNASSTRRLLVYILSARASTFYKHLLEAELYKNICKRHLKILIIRVYRYDYKHIIVIVYMPDKWNPNLIFLRFFHTGQTRIRSPMSISLYGILVAAAFRAVPRVKRLLQCCPVDLYLVPIVRFIDLSVFADLNIETAVMTAMCV